MTTGHPQSAKRSRSAAQQGQSATPLLGTLRRFCLSLPGTTEVEAWGHLNFRGGGKTFAVYEIYKGRPSIAVKAEVGLQELLVDDRRFFRTPYIGHRGWVSMWVDHPVKSSMMRDLVRSSYRLVAPRRHRKDLVGKRRNGGVR